MWAAAAASAATTPFQAGRRTSAIGRQRRLDQLSEHSRRGADGGQCLCRLSGNGSRCVMLAAPVAPRRCGRVSWRWSTSRRRPTADRVSVSSIPPSTPLRRDQSYATCFHDVTTGNNTWPSSPNLFYAASGYDLCTGLGTPNGTKFDQRPGRLRGTWIVSPLSGAAIGVAGGPFSITSGNFLLTNASSSPLTWSLVNTSAWLKFSATNGTLAAAAQTTLTCSLTATANNLAVGNYTAQSDLLQLDGPGGAGRAVHAPSQPAVGGFADQWICRLGAGRRPV